MTRYTLFRVLLALSFFSRGNARAARYLLPRKIMMKMRRHYWSALEELCVGWTLEILAQRIDKNYPPGKIGDTLLIRRPARYCR